MSMTVGIWLIFVKFPKVREISHLFLILNQVKGSLTVMQMLPMSSRLVNPPLLS